MDEADIVIGIPSYNNEKTIPFVTKKVDEGLQKYFPKKRALIVDSDGKSTDRTKEAFERTETVTEKLFVHYRNPVPGKGSAIKEIFEIAAAKNATAIATVDADLRSITSDWVHFLIDPITHGTDLITPYYIRYKYDATITNHICYPITYGLLCRNLRQPIGGDFSFSRKAVDFYLKENVWESDVAKFGIDIFLTSNALINNFEVKQVFLGTKIHDAKEPVYLKDMFKEVVGTLFEILNNSRKDWVGREIVENVEIVGKLARAEIEGFEVNSEKMLESFLFGKKWFEKDWKQILSGENYSEIIGMQKPSIDERLWCRIVYDFITAKKVEPLVPLWSGRNYTFVEETADLTQDEAEDRIARQAKIFYRERDYLIKKLRQKNE